MFSLSLPMIYSHCVVELEDWVAIYQKVYQEKLVVSKISNTGELQVSS